MSNHFGRLGSLFLSSSESCYALVEGGSLANVWALEQSRYFTQGYNNLLVLTDHKPLVKLFGDRTLDEIESPCLFWSKQRSLLWKFKIQNKTGKLHLAPDTLSRHPVETHYETEDKVEISSSEILAGVRLPVYSCKSSSWWPPSSCNFFRVREEALKDIKW